MTKQAAAADQIVSLRPHRWAAGNSAAQNAAGHAVPNADRGTGRRLEQASGVGLIASVWWAVLGSNQRPIG